MECGKLQEIRRQYGVYGTEAWEEVLMFMEKGEEKGQPTQEVARRDEDEEN